jgi:glucose-6-phosphate isomerase
VVYDINAAPREALGKALAQRIIPELESASEPKLAHDSSTNALIRRYRTRKGVQCSSE